jgi:hypothetical protein
MQTAFFFSDPLLFGHLGRLLRPTQARFTQYGHSAKEWSTSPNSETPCSCATSVTIESRHFMRQHSGYRANASRRNGLKQSLLRKSPSTTAGDFHHVDARGTLRPQQRSVAVTAIAGRGRCSVGVGVENPVEARVAIKSFHRGFWPTICGT